MGTARVSASRKSTRTTPTPPHPSSLTSVLSADPDLEWKLIYVGSAESEKYDQILDSVLVGPVYPGQYRFVFQVRGEHGAEWLFFFSFRRAPRREKRGVRAPARPWLPRPN